MKSAAPSRRTLLLLGGFVLLVAVTVGLSLNREHPPEMSPPPPKGAPQKKRVVSLSPGVTDTIVALGAGSSLVGLSDYCIWKDGTPKLPRMGSALTPSFEKISAAEPDAIILSAVRGSRFLPLERIAPTYSLPWLTLAEWESSVLTLGALLDKQTEAENLHARIARVLDVPRPEGGPRVLFALDYGDSGSNEIWYIRRNSIHGAVLRAAGAQNAVQKDVEGQAKLSPEQLLNLDPEGIVILLSDVPGEESRTRAALERWTPLVSVKEDKIDFLVAKNALNVGPGVLDLVPQLRKIVARFASSKGGSPAP